LIYNVITVKEEGTDMKENVAYILECADGTYYSGWTNDLDKRVKTHNSGKGGKYTRARLPVKVVYYETFPTKEEAMKREYQFKQLKRAQKEALIKGDTAK
jgi:putative endonuclease